MRKRTPGGTFAPDGDPKAQRPISFKPWPHQLEALKQIDDRASWLREAVEEKLRAEGRL